MPGYEENAQGKLPAIFGMNLSDNANVKFRTYQELYDWLSIQQSGLKELYLDLTDIGYPTRRKIEKLITSIDALLFQLNEMQKSVLNKEEFSKFFEFVRSLFDNSGTRYPIPTRESQFYKDIGLAIVDQNFDKIDLCLVHAFGDILGKGDKATSFEKLNNLHSLSDDDVDTGRVLEENNSPAIHDLTKFQETAKEQLKRFENNFESVSNSIKGLQSSVDQITPIHETVTEAVQKVEQGRSTFTRDLKSAQADITGTKDQAVKKIEGLVNLKTELKTLDQKISFWKDKRKFHILKAVSYFLIFVAWVGFFGRYLLAELNIYSQKVKLAETVYDLLPYLPKNILMILLAVWIARILMRLILNENHLYSKAEEKIALIRTYLALVEAKAAYPEDRQLMLNSIFMSTQVGVIEDDPVPPVHLSGFSGKP